MYSNALLLGADPALPSTSHARQQLPVAWLPPPRPGATRGQGPCLALGGILALITAPGSEQGTAYMCVTEINVLHCIYLIN